MQKTDFTFVDFYDPKIQELFLGLMARDVDFLARARGITKPKYFSTKIYRIGCAALFAYWDTYQTLPSMDDLANEVGKKAENEETKNAWAATIRELWDLSPDDLNRPYLENELATFAQRAEAAVVVGKAAKDLKSFDIEDVTRRLREIEEIPVAFTEIGKSVRETWQDTLEPDNRRVFLTGYEGLDAAMRGGVREGELIVVLAPMKRGKSLSMINMAAGLMSQGHDVIYYTLEMHELEVRKRVVACFANCPTNHLDEHITTVKEAMEMLALYTTADIRVKRFPALKHSVYELEAHYEMLMAEHRKRKRVDSFGEPLPYVPVVDYATLLTVGDIAFGKRGAASEKTWVDYPTIMVQLREMGIRFHIPIITGHQSNATGLKERKQDETHISGAKAIGAHVDYMFGIDQSEADYSVNRFIMRPFLSRNTRKDAVTYWRACYEHSRVEEISEKTFRDLLPEDQEERGRRPRRAPGGRQQ